MSNSNESLFPCVYKQIRNVPELNISNLLNVHIHVSFYLVFGKLFGEVCSDVVTILTLKCLGVASQFTRIHTLIVGVTLHTFLEVTFSLGIIACAVLSGGAKLGWVVDGRLLRCGFRGCKMFLDNIVNVFRHLVVQPNSLKADRYS